MMSDLRETLVFPKTIFKYNRHLKVFSLIVQSPEKLLYTVFAQFFK